MTELEAAEVIIQEAKDIVEGDLGGAAISWETVEGEEEEKDESKNGEDHNSSRIDSLEDKGNKNIDEDSKQKSCNPNIVGGNKTGLNFITPEKSIRVFCPKESNDKDLDGGASAANRVGSVKLTDNPLYISTKVSTNADPETIKRPKEGEEKEKLGSPHNSQAGSSRRRSSKSLDGSNCSSLNLSHSFHCGRRSNRKKYFGQTILSPPVGIVESALKSCHDKQRSPLNIGQEDTLFGTVSDKTTRLSFRLHSDKNVITSPLLMRDMSAYTGFHSNGIESDLQGTSKKLSEKEEEPKNMIAEYAFTYKSPADKKQYKDLSHSLLQVNNVREVNKSCNASEESNTQKSNQNDFSFSASFDLDSQAPKLVNSYYKRQKFRSEAKTSKDSFTESNLIVTKTKCNFKDAYDKELKQGNVLCNTKNDSFDDCFSEMHEGNELNSHSEVMSCKHMKLIDKTKEFLQYLPDKTVVCVDMAKNQNQEKDLNTFEGMEMKNGEEDEEQGSLIAASNRFDHFDEGMIENEFFDSFSVSFTQLKTESSEMINKIESKGSKSVSKDMNTDGPELLFGEKNFDSEVSNKTQTDEDENVLLAALDLSLSFETSPFSVYKESHGKNEPQNSTPVESFTNVLAMPNFAPQYSTNTPTSRSISSRRNLRHRRKLSDGMKNNHQSSPLAFKTTQSNQAISQPTAEEFFTDSFSLTLMDKMVIECDNLQAGTQFGCDDASINQCETARKQKREEKDDLNSFPDQSSKKGTVIEENIGSANSSRQDGSDCVPPTPPERSISHASPLKMSFYSPLKPKPFKNGSKLTNDCSPKPLNFKNLAEPLETKLSQKFNNGKVQKVDYQKKTFGKHKMNDKGIEESVPSEPATQLNMKQNQNDPDFEHQGPHSPLPFPQASPAGISSSVCRIPPTPIASQLTQQSFSIIDVCADRRLFESFISEWQTQSAFSLSVACEKLPLQGEKSDPQSATIGLKFNKSEYYLIIYNYVIFMLLQYYTLIFFALFFFKVQNFVTLACIVHCICRHFTVVHIFILGNWKVTRF